MMFLQTVNVWQEKTINKKFAHSLTHITYLYRCEAINIHRSTVSNLAAILSGCVAKVAGRGVLPMTACTDSPP